MLTTWQALLEHADTARLPAALGAAGYWTLLADSAALQRQLEATLTEPQALQLEALLQVCSQAQTVEAECLFRTALAMGLELGRL